MNSIVALDIPFTVPRNLASKPTSRVYKEQNVTFGLKLRPYHVPLIGVVLAPLLHYLSGAPTYVDTSLRGAKIVDQSEMDEMATGALFNKSLDLQIEAMNACADARKLGIDIHQILKEMGLEIPAGMEEEDCSLPRGIFDKPTLEALIKKIEDAIDHNPYGQLDPLREIT